MAVHDPYASPETRRESGVLWTVVVAILAATVLLAGLLTALTTDDDAEVSADPLALLSSAPEAVLKARTARLVMKMEVDGGVSMDMSAEGLVDFESGASSMTMSLMGTEMEMRTVDGHLYVRMPEVGRPPGITEWVGMPLAAAGAGSYTGSPNAAGMIESLRGVSSDIEELGRDEVNGEDAIGYRVTIDMERALAQVPEEDRARVEESMAQMRAMGMADVPMEVWVTDDGLPVRMVMELRDVGGTGAGMRMQMDYVDFGVPVDITAPPADDTTMVQDQAELQQLFGGTQAEGTVEEELQPA